MSLSSLRRYVSKTSIASAVAAIRTPPGGSNLQKQSQQQSDRWRLWLVVAAFFLVVVALVVAAHVAYYRHIGEVNFALFLAISLLYLSFAISSFCIDSENAQENAHDFPRKSLASQKKQRF